MVAFFCFSGICYHNIYVLIVDKAKHFHAAFVGFYERQTGNSFFLWIVSNCRLAKCYQEQEELMHMLLWLDADETLCSYVEFLTIICNTPNELCTLFASLFVVLSASCIQNETL